jgi:eukaryotic-like serine/threonine-protein kinase
MATVPAAIGRFAIERRLGAGGFATVWLAHDPELDAPVAVKILADNWAANGDVRRRFADEARLLRRVDNDLVVRVYDVGTLDDGRPYLVMTYADAGSLADRMAADPPPWPVNQVLDVVDAVAGGLAALHAHGIVHRDVGPQNVLFRRTSAGAERVLLGDLGIAKDLTWASGLTQPAGTAGYQAPEQAVVSADVGPATDVHALAVTAAALLGVERPWPSSPVGDVLRRATAADPRQRTPDPARFAAELRGALTGTAAPRSRIRIWLAAAAAVVLLAGLTWVATHQDVRYVSAGGRISVALAGEWTTSAVLVPAETAGEGVRLVRDGRSVSAAFAPVAGVPEQVAARHANPECPTSARQVLDVGDLRGAAVAWSGCPGAVTVTEAALADPARTGWVVWVEVRSVDGTPAVADVLRGLAVHP